jgi:hypothetical protein
VRLAEDPEAKRARAEYRKSVSQGQALSDRALGAKWCLPDAAVDLRAEAEGVMVVGGLAETLDGEGWLRDRPAGGVSPLPTPPRRSAFHDASASLTFAGWRALAGAVRDVRRAERGGDLVSMLAVAGTGEEAGDERTVLRAAAALRRVQPWLPFDGECLQRSALLIAFLRRLGLGADWVFAVRLWPFNAHCWVQLGDICLNDDHERLQAYTPIYRR